MFNYLRLLFTLLWQPNSAIRSLSGRTPLGMAAGVAWAVTTAYSLIIAVGFGRFWIVALRGAATFALLMVLFVAFVYTPFTIFLAHLLQRRSDFSHVMRETYAPMVTCALSIAAIALLVMLLPAILIAWQSHWLSTDALINYLIMQIIIPLPVCVGLMMLAVRVIFSIGWIGAVLVTVFSLLLLFTLPILAQVFSFIRASPFLLLLLFFLLRDRISGFLHTQRARQAFKQNLEAATLNPADASAHYNLGLLYQQRGDFDAAEASFKRAIEITTHEIDAYYQLGRIARERGRLPEAIAYFETVVREYPTHSQHEIWREVARTYLAAKQYEDALEMLDRFLAKRPSDAEARYWRGQALAGLGHKAEAEAEMQHCIESVRTSPAYKYRREQQWLKLAEQFLRRRRAGAK